MLAPFTVARRLAGVAVLLILMAIPALAVPTVTGTAAQPTVTPAAPSVATPAAMPPIKWLVNGYVQGRFEDVLGQATTNNTFEIKRAYINVLAKVNDHIAGGIMVGGIPSTKVYEAFGEYTVDPSLKGRLGLYRLPFGY
ncbi:MAG TPA: hypothetical protein VGL77_14005, partial [Armatimonadota bacterium]